MATGAVAVATDVGGARELIVPGETGDVVAVGRADLVADAILVLLADPARASRLALAARARVEERFAVDAMVRRTEAAYGELLREAGVGVRAASAA
jgi:glycosyltransferase involved in cell wall biosynthesis